MKKRTKMLMLIVLLVIVALSTGCAFHSETSLGIGDGPTISTTSTRSIHGRSARD